MVLGRGGASSSSAHSRSTINKVSTRERFCHAITCRLFFLVLALVVRVEGAYFYVNEGAERCFHETVAEHQVLTVKYKNIDNAGIPCTILVKDARKVSVFSKLVESTQESGKTAYMTQKSGNHQVCIACSGSKWFAKSVLKWELSVEVGDTEVVAATKGDMHGITREAAAALARLDAISAENEYEHTTENEFRDVSETVNSRVVFCTVFIIVVEGLLATWQISSLKSYFQTQKLIG